MHYKYMPTKNLPMLWGNHKKRTSCLSSLQRSFQIKRKTKEEERRSSPEYQAKKASIKEKNKEQLAGL